MTGNWVESYATLVGARGSRYAAGQMGHYQDGEPSSVEFNWKHVMEREEKYGDVVGFYHTHPEGHSDYSARDYETMTQWVDCFGKTLVCAIQNGREIRAWEFAPKGIVNELSDFELKGLIFIWEVDKYVELETRTAIQGQGFDGEDSFGACRCMRSGCHRQQSGVQSS